MIAVTLMNSGASVVVFVTLESTYRMLYWHKIRYYSMNNLSHRMLLYWLACLSRSHTHTSVDN